MGHLIDLTGRTFSYLEVVRLHSERDKQGNILWECLCECGSLCNRPSARLNNGTARHCGCRALSKTVAKLALTQQRLKELVSYDSEKGGLKRKLETNGRTGSRSVGWVGKNGHISANLDGHRYAVHRLVWMYFHGKWPSLDIDHIDGNPANNRIENLRDVGKFLNLQNLKGPKKNNKSGYLGVAKQTGRNRWSACIKVEGVSKYIGSFATPEAASKAYLSAKRMYHPGCTI